jgi:hypothetical protein
MITDAVRKTVHDRGEVDWADRSPGSPERRTLRAQRHLDSPDNLIST